MAEAVPDCNDQSLQHFLTNSLWDDQMVVGQVAHVANALLGGLGNSCLVLAESACRKRVTNRLVFPGNCADSSVKQITVRSVYNRPFATVSMRFLSAFGCFYPKPVLMTNNDA